MKNALKVQKALNSPTNQSSNGQLKLVHKKDISRFHASNDFTSKFTSKRFVDVGVLTNTMETSTFFNNLISDANIKPRTPFFSHVSMLSYQKIWTNMLERLGPDWRHLMNLEFRRNIIILLMIGNAEQIDDLNSLLMDYRNSNDFLILSRKLLESITCSVKEKLVKILLLI